MWATLVNWGQGNKKKRDSPSKTLAKFLFCSRAQKIKIKIHCGARASLGQGRSGAGVKQMYF